MFEKKKKDMQVSGTGDGRMEAEVLREGRGWSCRAE
jgi:hypothetical protein